MKAVWLAVLVACSHPPKHETPRASDAAVQKPDAMQTPDAQKIDWRIEPGRVGPAELGKPLPEALAADETRYLARFIADAQPIDAFRFDDPPLMVIVDGPFAASHADAAAGATERLRGKAVEAARGGAAVKLVMITGAGPKTAGGAGVGTTLAELQQAYPDVKLAALPETLGHDTCAAHTKQLPGVAFVFASCAKAKAGEPVTRVDVSAVSPAQ